MLRKLDILESKTYKYNWSGKCTILHVASGWQRSQKTYQIQEALLQHKINQVGVKVVLIKIAHKNTTHY